MDKWIEILEYVSTIDANDSCYLTSLKHFLNGRSCPDGEDSITTIDLTSFMSAWARACDIPSGLSRDKVTIKNALKVVNSFRNRLAHVPFPYDPISDVYRGLESCTEQLFSAYPKPTSENGTLSGSIGYRGQVIKGSTPLQSPLAEPLDSAVFIFGFKDKGLWTEKWDANLFIHIDTMLRPYILTRLRDDAGLWEYTRYLAESNAVVTIQKPDYLEQLPIPSERDYLSESEGEPSVIESTLVAKEGTETEVSEHEELVVKSMGDANWAIRTRMFAPAIKFLEELLENRQDYHVGWLRLGHAKREFAVDLHIQSGTDDTDHMPEIRGLLESSLNDFCKAKGHISAPYRAEAHYHASKSYLRLWQYFKDESFLA